MSLHVSALNYNEGKKSLVMASLVYAIIALVWVQKEVEQRLEMNLILKFFTVRANKEESFFLIQ